MLPMQLTFEFCPRSVQPLLAASDYRESDLESCSTSVARHTVPVPSRAGFRHQASDASSARQSALSAPLSAEPSRQGGCCGGVPALAFLGIVFLGAAGVGLNELINHIRPGPLSHSQAMAFYLTWGSLVSLLACFTVMWDYLTRVASRRHPSPVIYYRTAVNMVLAAAMLGSNVRMVFAKPEDATIQALDCDSSTGWFVASVIQFSAISSEGWFVVLIVDLLTSLTNPFADYLANMRKYHISVWTLGLGSVGLMLSLGCAGELTKGVCWLTGPAEREAWQTDHCLWIVYLGWVAVIYAYGFSNLLWARYKIMGHDSSKAVEEVRLARARVVAYILSALYVYLAYAVVLAASASLLAVALRNAGLLENQATARRWAKHTLAFLFTARGYVDAAVWFGFQRDAKHSPSSVTLGLLSRLSFTSTASGMAGLQPSDSGSKAATIAELDLDLSPQLNPVLRSEVVSNVTKGIRTAVTHHISIAKAAAERKQRRSQHLLTKSSEDREGDAYSSASSTASGKSWSGALGPAIAALSPIKSMGGRDGQPPPLATGTDMVSHVDFVLESGNQFRDFWPASFRRLRELAGLTDDEDYCRQVENIAAEKLSEGASGAFMFISANGRRVSITR